MDSRDYIESIVAELVNAPGVSKPQMVDRLITEPTDEGAIDPTTKPAMVMQADGTWRKVFRRTQKQVKAKGIPQAEHDKLFQLGYYAIVGRSPKTYDLVNHYSGNITHNGLSFDQIKQILTHY